MLMKVNASFCNFGKIAVYPEMAKCHANTLKKLSEAQAVKRLEYLKYSNDAQNNAVQCLHEYMGKAIAFLNDSRKENLIIYAFEGNPVSDMLFLQQYPPLLCLEFNPDNFMEACEKIALTESALVSYNHLRYTHSINHRIGDYQDKSMISSSIHESFDETFEKLVENYHDQCVSKCIEALSQTMATAW